MFSEGIFAKDISRFFQQDPNPFFARNLPYPVFRTYIRTLGRIYYYFRPDEKVEVIRSLIGAMEDQIPQERLKSALKEIFQGIFDHYAEKLYLAYRPPSQTRTFLSRNSLIKDVHILDQMSLSGKGFILVTGHFGAVEFLASVLSINHYRTAMIARFKTERLKRAMNEMARAYDIIPIDGGEGGVFIEALKYLRKGRILITLCDEFKYWKPDSKSFVQVLWERVPQDKTLDLLYKRAKAPVCLGLLTRVKNKYELLLESIAAGEESISVSLRSWELLQKYIRKYPEQWYQWNSVAKGLSTYKLKFAHSEAV